MKRLGQFTAVLASVALFAFSAAAQEASAPTVAEAAAFLQNVERRLLQLSVEAGRADWVKLNFITEDTELLAARREHHAGSRWGSDVPGCSTTPVTRCGRIVGETAMFESC